MSVACCHESGASQVAAVMQVVIVHGVAYLFLSPSCTLHSGTPKNVNELKIAQQGHFWSSPRLHHFFAGEGRIRLHLGHQSCANRISCTRGTMCAETLILLIWRTVKARSKPCWRGAFLLNFSTNSLLIERFGNIHHRNGSAPVFRGGGGLGMGYYRYSGECTFVPANFSCLVDRINLRSTAIRCSSCTGKCAVHGSVTCEIFTSLFCLAGFCVTPPYFPPLFHPFFRWSPSKFPRMALKPLVNRSTMDCKAEETHRNGLKKVWIKNVAPARSYTPHNVPL